MNATDEQLITAIAITAVAWLPILVALIAARRTAGSRAQAEKGNSAPALSGLLLSMCGFLLVSVNGDMLPHGRIESSRKVFPPELFGPYWDNAHSLGVILGLFAAFPLAFFGYRFALDIMIAAQTWRLTTPGAPHAADVTNGILLQRNHRRDIAEESLAAALADRHHNVFGDRPTASDSPVAPLKSTASVRVLVDVAPSFSGTTTRFSFNDSSDRTQDILADLATAVNEASIIRSATTTTDESGRPVLVIEWDDAALYNPTAEFEYSYQYPYEPLAARIKEALQPQGRAAIWSAFKAWRNSLSDPGRYRVEATPAGLDNIPYKSNLAVTLAAVGMSAQRRFPGSWERPAPIPAAQPA